MQSQVDNRSSRGTRGALAVAALAVILGASAVPDAEASTISAGNSVVRNTITVNYSDAKNVAQTAVSASVDITVTTVAATPTILSYSPASGSTDGTAATQPYTVRIRTNSNGPGLITLSAADTAPSNMSLYGAGSPSGLAANVFLGSTIIDPADGNGNIGSWAINASINFRVPNDGGGITDGAVTGGTNSDGVVNGLKIGDIVYLYSGSAYYGPFSVGTVTESAAGSVVPCIIPLINNQPGAVALSNVPTAYGWQIVEAKDVTMTVTQGTVTDPTLAAGSNWTTTVTATMAGATAATAPAVVTNSHMGKIAISKYVRNTVTAVGTGTVYTPPVPINGFSNTFYSGGVTGKPGEILEYLAVLNDAGSGDVKGVYATDILPPYTTLVAATTYGGGVTGKIFAHARFNGVEADLNNDNSGGAVNVAYGNVTGSPSTMYFWLGTGSTTAAGGTLNTSIPAAQPTSTAYIIYQVRIN